MPLNVKRMFHSLGNFCSHCHYHSCSKHCGCHVPIHDTEKNGKKGNKKRKKRKKEKKREKNENSLLNEWYKWRYNPLCNMNNFSHCAVHTFSPSVGVYLQLCWCHFLCVHNDDCCWVCFHFTFFWKKLKSHSFQSST